MLTLTEASYPPALLRQALDLMAQCSQLDQCSHRKTACVRCHHGLCALRRGSQSEPPKPREEQIPGKNIEKTLVEEVAVSISTCGSKCMRCADQRRFLQTTRGSFDERHWLDATQFAQSPARDLAAVALGVLQALPLASRFCGVTGMHTECDGLKGFLPKSFTDPGHCSGHKKTERIYLRCRSS